MTGIKYSFGVWVISLTVVGLSAQLVWADKTPNGYLLYVALNGRDNWSGTLSEPNPDLTDGPLATPTRARDVIRKRIAQGLTEPITVLLRGGIYYLTEALVFGPQDSGTSDFPITYTCYPGEKTILSGASPITAPWNKPAKGHIWTVQLSKDTRIEDLYVGGQRRTRARLPNTNTFQAKDIDKSHQKFRYKPGELANWDDLSSAMIILRAYQWKVHHVPIASIDEKNQTVKLAHPIDYPIVPSIGSKYGRYYVENVLAALDRPGEWCLNYQTGVLSYWPDEDVDLTRDQVHYPRTKDLLLLRGNAEAGKYVEHVTIKGLTFRHSSRNGTAVRLEMARNCALVNNTWVDVCRNGLLIRDGSRNIRVVGNKFVRIGRTPITIGGSLQIPRGEGQSQFPTPTGANTITDNHLQNCGAIFHDATGISMSKSKGNLIAHNHIHDMPYIGISLTGAIVAEWKPKQVPFIEPPITFKKTKPFIPLRGNKVAYNHIHNVMQRIKDGGAIYAFGTTGVGSNLIHHNLIHHIGQDEGAVGIYLDDESDGYKVHDNIVYSSNVGLLLHGSPDNIIENNIFAYTNVADLWLHPETYNIPPMDNIVRRNIWYMGKGELYKLVGGKRLEDGFWSTHPFKVLDYNLYWRGGSTVELGLEKGLDRNSLMADPMFVNPERGNFTLKPDSPAHKLGFRSIDLTDVGIRSK
ncbi:MAG: NosD domain-containing protein [Planctomycetota bacterium]|jgi:parallel beta-helix repeat protein